MGLIKKDGDAKAQEQAPEDTPIVKQLKELDDKYMEIEKEFNAAVMKLQLEYTKLQQPILEERKKMLTEGEASSENTGTPALKGFWLKALQNHPELSENIQTWDEPVLEYLTDITRVFLEEADLEKGFKLIFTFSENPYFSNAVIEKEHIMGEMNPFNGERRCTSVKTTEIQWKEGKNVTVQLVSKKVKGGGAKKAKAKKPKEEPRESFFRDYFRSMYPGCPALAEMKISGDDDEEDEDEEDDDEMLEYLLEEDLDKGNAVADYIIPYATHWYTGEAVPEGFERDDDDEEEEEEEDFSEDDSDEPSDPKGKKGGGKAKAKAADKKSGSGDAGEKKQEECKQQ